jgi:hypothetical protein
MKKSLFAVASAITILANGPVSAQTTMNAPYYANPSWDQQLPAAQRFIVLENWNNQAVLDRETGLIWERQPVIEVFPWAIAMEQCHRRFISHRKGWRLPSVEELNSLLDDTQSNPALPAGHPFLGIGGSDQFWTTTQLEQQSPPFGPAPYIVSMFDATITEGSLPDLSNRFWCVRGGSATANPPY